MSKRQQSTESLCYSWVVSTCFKKEIEEVEVEVDWRCKTLVVFVYIVFIQMDDEDKYPDDNTAG